ncbi:hypothetical protein RB213_003762 [Colletotrichum asianum]
MPRERSGVGASTVTGKKRSYRCTGHTYVPALPVFGPLPEPEPEPEPEPLPPISGGGGALRR